MTRTRRITTVKKRKPLERRGLLRTIRRHPLSRLSGSLALLSYILIAFTPLWVPAVERDGIAICTGNGIQIIPAADLPVSGLPADKPKTNKDCPLCRIQTTHVLVPIEFSFKTVDFSGMASGWFTSSETIAGLCAGFDHHSRAPPLHT